MSTPRKAYQDTSVSASRSRGHIAKLFTRDDIKGIQWTDDCSGETHRVTLRVLWSFSSHTYPLRFQLEYTKNDAKESRRLHRALYWHLHAMFAAADSGVVELARVLMPYIEDGDGVRIGDKILSQIASGPNFLALPREVA